MQAGVLLFTASASGYLRFLKLQRELRDFIWSEGKKLFISKQVRALQEYLKLLMCPQHLHTHTEILKQVDPSITKEQTTECMRRKWLRLKFIKDRLNGTGFPLTALFYMARLLYGKKPTSWPTPIQTLNQPCCKATEWISNQDPYSWPPCSLSVQDTTHPTTTNTQISC